MMSFTPIGTPWSGRSRIAAPAASSARAWRSAGSRIEIDPGMNLIFARIDAREAIAHDRFAGGLAGCERAPDLGSGELVERRRWDACAL